MPNVLIGQWRRNIHHLQRLDYLSISARHMMVQQPANRFKRKPIVWCSSNAISALGRTIRYYYYAMMPLFLSENKGHQSNGDDARVHWQINSKSESEPKRACAAAAHKNCCPLQNAEHKTNGTKTRGFFSCVFFFSSFFIQIVWVMTSSISHMEQLSN